MTDDIGSSVAPKHLISVFNEGEISEQYVQFLHKLTTGKQDKKSKFLRFGGIFLCVKKRKISPKIILPAPHGQTYDRVKEYNCKVRKKRQIQTAGDY